MGFQSYGCFIFKSIWISKVTDNLLLGKNKRKSQTNFKIVDENFVKLCVVKRYLISLNYFKIYITQIYILRSGDESFFLHTFHQLCFSIVPGNVLCYHNKHLRRYFEFLPSLKIICLRLNISEKLYYQHLFEKLEESETHRLHLC